MEVLPDWEIGDEVDAERGHLSGGTHARAQQDRGTSVRAAGEDHLASEDLDAARGYHADRAAPVEAQPLGLPAVPARPWDTVLERVIAALQPAP